MADTTTVTIAPDAKAGEAVTLKEGETHNKPGGMTTATATLEAVAKPAAEEKLLAGKFKTADDLEKGYVELQKQFSARKPEAAPVAASVQAVADAGFDINALTQEYVASGKLSDDTMIKLAQKGIGPDAVNTIVAGQVAAGEKIADDIASVAGGREEMKAVTEWFKVNGTQEQKEAIAAATKSGNPALLKLAMQPIVGQYHAATGTEPKVRVQGSQTVTSGAKPFESSAQMVEAMRDKRYRNDPAYRKAVKQRVAAGI